MNNLTFIIAPIVALIIILSLRKIGQRKGGKAGILPPGDCGFRIHVFTAFVKSSSPWILTDFLTEQFAKHGRIFTTRLGVKKMIVSSDPDLNRFVLQNEKHLFDTDIPSHTKPLLGHSDLFLTTGGEQYGQIKSIILSFLHSWDIRTKFLEEVHTAADRILDTWLHKDIVLVSEEATKFAFSIIAQKTMGMNYDDPEGEQLQKEFSTLDGGIYALPVNLPNTRYRKAINAKKNINKIINKRVESRKMENKENEKPTDLIDRLLENYSHESVQKITDSLFPIIFASLINLAKAIALAIYFLSNCPEAVQQMREEHLEILRAKKDIKGKLSWDDYKNLKFTQCVINEALRLGNIIPALSKKAKQDVEFKGYVIPKGTRILIYMAATHLDPTAFERSESFDPWRWQSMERTKNLMPFGAGVRYCSGNEIAKVEIAIFLFRFLLKYNWEPVELDHPIAHPVVFPNKLPITVYPFNATFKRSQH